MNHYLKDGRMPGENKDCSVIALAYAFDIDYMTAHRICKKNGRIDKKGFNLNHVFKLTSGKQKRSRQFLGRRIGYHAKRPGMSVGRFQQTHPEGIYIIRVGGHIFTMIDGVIFNNANLAAKISYYFYVSNPPQNDSTSGQQKVDDTNPICSEEKSVEARCQQMDQPGQNSSQAY